MESTVESFIEKVKIRPCLWNIHHVSYRDIAKKETLWERVAKECGLANGREARMQWKKLRDSHREALRRQKPAAGPSAQFLRPWKYEEHLKFILTQTENHREAQFISNDSNDTEESVNDNATENKMIEIPEPEMLSLPETLINTDQYTSGRNKIREERERRRGGMRQQSFDRNRSDALATLFDSLYQKTRELPKYLQLRVQREIFASVSQAEEEALSLTTGQDPIGGYSLAPSSSSVQYNDMNASKEPQEDYVIESDTEIETKYST